MDSILLAAGLNYGVAIQKKHDSTDFLGVEDGRQWPCRPAVGGVPSFEVALTSDHPAHTAWPVEGVEDEPSNGAGPNRRWPTRSA